MKEKTLDKLSKLKIGETLKTKKWIYKKEGSSAEDNCYECCFRAKLISFCSKINCDGAIYTREAK